MQEVPPQYKIEFDDRGSYAYARIAAPRIDRQMAFSYLAEIVMCCAELRRKRLIIERDIPELMNDTDMAQAMSKLLSMGSGMKIAILNRDPSIGEALEKAVNAACGSDSNCAYFNDSYEAETWILGGDSSE